MSACLCTQYSNACLSKIPEISHSFKMSKKVLPGLIGWFSTYQAFICILSNLTMLVFSMPKGFGIGLLIAEISPRSKGRGTLKHPVPFDSNRSLQSVLCSCCFTDHLFLPRQIRKEATVSTRLPLSVGSDRKSPLSLPSHYSKAIVRQ